MDDYDAHPSHGSGGKRDWEAVELVKESRASARAHTRSKADAALAIDIRRSRFPFCIVWTPLPPITWFLPFIGHMGITDSRGVIYDFAGPYTIGIDDMAFGRPTRYLQLDPELVTNRQGYASAAEAWDAGIDEAANVYCRRMHNICCDNCHSHVARALNHMGYGATPGRTMSPHTMVTLAARLFFLGTYTHTRGILLTWAPFLVFIALVLGLRFGIK